MLLMTADILCKSRYDVGRRFRKSGFQTQCH